ncbi:MAG TPA: hypothetical protein DDX39_09955 [Bacteroidales bacterium]|nr:MAG: hypothetical protein A2W98_01420 [Bacteroidetes bacterium GWF2_33_38]OFY91359.1 MAG: hypothetical protein A2236_13855 [Bacteroidetes bacterium RIFOXYA2_FULL_33_7]HBF88953.1 hypothetical protein [Bacteroidales bacterium]
MKKFSIIFSESARSDIKDILDFIEIVCKSPITAKQYVDGIRKEVNSLSNKAHIYQIATRKSILKYGHNARRVNYKKIAIIYTIHNDIVVIRRVIPGGTISGI